MKRRRRRDHWRQAIGGVAQAKQLLSRYDYDPQRPPPLPPNRTLEADWDHMLKDMD